MKFFKPTEPVLTRGKLEKSIMVDGTLHLQGWVTSFEQKKLDGMLVSIAGQEFRNIELTYNLPSPGVKKKYPYIPGTEKARYQIRIPLTKQQQKQFKNSLVLLTPSLDGQPGGIMTNALESSLPIPPHEYIKFVGGHFTDVGFNFLGYSIQMVGLEPTDKVLDIGCGVGRIAYPLTYYLKEGGGYEGFDISEKLIKWAKSEISLRFPNFNFQVVDIHNKMYNPEGNVQTLDFVFPYQDKSFDWVVLTSVFTHLQAKEVRHYLDEITRVLKPRGRCLCTCFLLNPESEAAMTKNKKARQIVHPLEECFTATPKIPESTIGYKEGLLLGWMQERGLSLAGKYYGHWCGRRKFTSHQDILVLQKS